MKDVHVYEYMTDSGKRFRYRFEIANIKGERRWCSKRGFETKAEALKHGREAQRNYESIGEIISPTNMSYSDYLDYWIKADCEVDLKVNTIDGYKKRIDNYIKPRIGKFYLKSIKRENFQDFLIKMFDEGFSVNTLVSIKAIITKSINYAYDNHFITHLPCLRLKIPRNRAPKIQTRENPHVLISQEIMEKIFDRFNEQSSNFLALKLGYECGLRLGETFALCWEDVDFENNTISINRQIQWQQDFERNNTDKRENNGTSECGNGFWYFAPPKYDSYRVIDISEELCLLLQREKERQEKGKCYYDDLYMNYYCDSKLSFTGEKPKNPIQVNKVKKEGKYHLNLINVRPYGELISPRTIQHTSRIIRKEIFPEFDYHSLRVTHASMLAEMRVDQKYIQKRLGHKKLYETINTYERLTDGMRKEGKDALNKMFVLK